MADVLESTFAGSGAAMPCVVIEVSQREEQTLALRKERRFQPSIAGFLLLDTSFNPMSCYPEAVKILGYPKRAQRASPDGFLRERIGSTFGPAGSSASSFPKQLTSGRRRYARRKLPATAALPALTEPAAIVVLPERNSPQRFDGNR